MSRPLVTVIIPVKNGERYLRATIESVLEQTYEPVEILISDGQSTDSTAEIAASFPQVRYVRETGTASIANGRNLGVREARGELIAFVSADDHWAPEKLSRQVEALAREPAAQYSVCMLRHFCEGEAPARQRQELLERDVVGNMPETVLARATLFAEVGGFDPALDTAEDLEWFQRLRDRGVPFTVVHETLLFKRVHAESLSFDSRPAFERGAMRIFRERVRRARAAADAAESDRE